MAVVYMSGICLGSLAVTLFTLPARSKAQSQPSLTRLGLGQTMHNINKLLLLIY